MQLIGIKFPKDIMKLLKISKMDKKRLTRDTKNKVLAGVCSGIGNYFEVDPVVIRLVWVIFTLVTGVVPGILAYIIAWIIIPEK